jgi:hypothetical protein
MAEVAIEELRRLIVKAAPDPARARPIETCPEDQPLDAVAPFSSVIVLGVVVAIEDRWGVRITKTMLARALEGGVTLRKLATLVETAGAKD